MDWKDKKRRASNSLFDADRRQGECVKSGLEIENASSNIPSDIIVIDDEDEKLPEALDAAKVVSFFRVSLSDLG